MRPAVHTVAVAVLITSCGRPSAAPTSETSTTATAPVPNATSTITPGSVIPTSGTSISQPPSPLDDGCDGVVPSTWLEMGTRSTIAKAPDPLIATIAAEPDVVCSGGSTSITVTVRNEGSAPVAVASLQLMLVGYGPWKWDLAELPGVALEAGQSISTVMTVSVPLVEPGDYRLFLYGYSGGGDLSIARPRGG